MSFQELANATLLIESRDSRGSGFQFVEPDIVVTNAHVVEPTIQQGVTAQAITEDGISVDLALLEHSPPQQKDFAVLRTVTDLPDGRNVLNPKTDRPDRGSAILFAGFPHGVDDLLVHEAPVSGPSGNHGFYIDGSVNGGNSGGPIVSKETGEVVGIITQRRFLGQVDMNRVGQQLSQIDQHFQQMGGSAGVVISGVDFGKFARLMSDAVSVFNEVIMANANSGIGIGYYIEYVEDRYQQAVK